MKRFTLCSFATAITLMILASVAQADAVRLVNGDTLKGKVASLSGNELQLQSENFGELVIPRDKIHSIYLGDAEPPIAQAPAGRQQMPAQAGPLGQSLPSLQNPQVQHQLQHLLGNLMGGAEMQNLQQNATEAQRGLKELKKGMGGPESEAIDAYIRLFEHIAPPPTQAQPEAQQRGNNPPERDPQEQP